MCGMKKKDALQKLKTKPEQDLKKELSENKDRLWSLKSDLASGKIKNVAEIKSVKKNIARVKTLLNQKS